MATILAFESRSVTYLLDDEFKEYFEDRDNEEDRYPLFYKNKFEKTKIPGKYFYRNAIDIALRSNQKRSIEKIIEYICKYQNSFHSSFMFT